MAFNNLYITFTIILLSHAQNTLSQPQTPTETTCNGIYLSYNYTGGRSLPPSDNPSNQPYRFESTLTIRNNARDTLKSWRVSVGFQHNVILVSASNAVLVDGTSLPAFVGNETVLAGFPQSDLKSAIETAGDLSQMEAHVQLVGTWFRTGSSNISLPASISLVNDGYSCLASTTRGTELSLCCTRDLNFVSNNSLGDVFEPRKEGDLIIMYDVISTYKTDYWAQVTISNHNPLGRLDNWKLSWEWMRDEFIYSMKGAYPLVVDSTDCIFGRQGVFYDEMDFSKVLNCERRPTIVDLPLDRANNTEQGLIPFCCRNGTILPPQMDPSKSISAFQMHVFKMQPDLNRTKLVAPQNWKISGTFNSDYQCGVPVPVSPSLFPDPRGLQSNTAAVASWQVVCNITKFRDEKPKCCVSFSAFFNDSVVPCSTCACGCNNNPSQTCDANEPALLLPSQSLLLPFENRTAQALDWAEMKRRTVPNPLPCGDNCGVSINWHLLSDYKSGWTARITLFNWGDTDFADWFTAVELDRAGTGFEGVYSFNGSALPNSTNTIFMQGLKDFNYLIAERDGKNPKKDPRVPGTLQSVISFTKKGLRDIDVAGPDGFPTKVLFNGEECALPTVRPTNSGHKSIASTNICSLLLSLTLLLIHSSML